MFDSRDNRRKINVWSTNKFSNEEHTAVLVVFSVPSSVQKKNGENFSYAIICKPASVFELDFLEAYHIHKNHNNVVNCDFAIPPLSDCWKSFIRSNFS